MFGRALREAGLEIGPGRVAEAVAGLDRVDLGRRDDVYWTLRQTLVARREDFETFDRAFAAWFECAPPELADRARDESLHIVTGGGPPGYSASDGEPNAGDSVTLGWAPDELLRRKDFSTLTASEFARLRVLTARLSADRPTRRSRRQRADRRGTRLDMRRLVRNSLATGGDPLKRAFRERKLTERKLVVVCDVSGSMEPYSRALLLFVHSLVGSGPHVEAFVFGTRLTRLTQDMRTRDAERLLAATASRLVDWSSGTRIGASLKQLNDEWGSRATTRGAVVVIISDGWERDDPDLVAREMARLARVAYAVVWVNPLKGYAEYQPLAAGMRAALPYVDRFLPGHDLLSLEQLAEVVGSI
jgi:hypothetical protein